MNTTSSVMTADLFLIRHSILLVFSRCMGGAIIIKVLSSWLFIWDWFKVRIIHGGELELHQVLNLPEQAWRLPIV